MKKFVRILFAAVLAVIIAGCSDSRNKFTITGGELDSVRLSSPITAVVNVDISNHSYKVTVSDISGKLKSGGTPLLDLKAEDFTIPAKADSRISIPIEASLEPGVGLITIMRTLGGGNFEGMTVDLTFTATGFLGIKKTQTLNDIPVKDIIGLL